MTEMTLPSSELLAPTVTDGTRPFWEWTARGELRVQRCEECRRFRFPPLPACPNCGSFKTSWEPVEGTPTLYSWVIVHRAVSRDIPVPYCVAIAEFDQAIHIAGNLVYDPELETPRAGDELTLGFHDVAGFAVPVYHLDADD